MVLLPMFLLILLQKSCICSLQLYAPSLKPINKPPPSHPILIKSWTFMPCIQLLTSRTSHSMELSILTTPSHLLLVLKNNPDILSQCQMLKATDQEKFIASQLPEIQGLVDADVFEFCSMSELLPRACLLNAVWSYHHKCDPNRYLLKHKSRICADGSQQQYSIDYWETYAPIIHWSMI